MFYQVDKLAGKVSEPIFHLRGSDRKLICLLKNVLSRYEYFSSILDGLGVIFFAKKGGKKNIWISHVQVRNRISDVGGPR